MLPRYSTTLRHTALAVTLATLAMLQLGCPAFAPPSGLGVTFGGAQDIAEARAQIRSGAVPPPSSVTVQGLLSEHSVPLSPPDNAPDIYAATGIAYRQTHDTGVPVGDIFVQLGTTIDVANFQRRPQNLAVVIDRSRSMRDPASAVDDRPKLDAIKQALTTLLDQLGPDDLLTIVSFADRVTVDVPPTAASQRQVFTAAIDRLFALGGTNLFAGMETAFEQVKSARSDARDNRVIVFTDAQPTSGETDNADILAMAQRYAADDIGLTLMGVGVNYGRDLLNDLALVRGGNGFYLDSADRITSIFTDEFAYFVTPAAYDFLLRVEVRPEVGIRNVYGVPGYTPGLQYAEVFLPTLFFSSRVGGGAIVIRLTSNVDYDFAQPVQIGTVGVAYTAATDGARREVYEILTLPADLDPTAATPWYSNPGAQRGALLLDTALVLQRALEQAAARDISGAINTLDAFLGAFDQRMQGLSDRVDPDSRALSDERNLLDNLRANLSNSYYYGGYYPFVPF